jgi:glycyl-tRNA synthetase beta chain
VAINNTPVPDAALAAAGHQRVLRARLEDALFFFKADRDRPLAERVDDLAGLIFQAGLGNMLEKTGRIVRLATMLAEQLAPVLATPTARAARLAKADLLTAMVNEFPTLQGVIGREYALLDGEEEAVATAIAEHYRPLRATDEPPRQIPGALVGLADRLDSIGGIFGLGRVPSGTADPFGLRRLSLGLLRIIETHAFSFSLTCFIDQALTLYGDKLTVEPAVARRQVLEFIRARFINDQVSRGLPVEAVEAVTSVAFDDVTDCLARIRALERIRKQPAFGVLAGTFKRVMNIIKEHSAAEPQEKLLVEPAERALYQAFLGVREAGLPLLARKDYDGALAIMLRMKEPADTFFDQVMVMAEDEALRTNRLNLLAAIAGLFLRVGDFSRMQGMAGENS